MSEERSLWNAPHPREWPKLLTDPVPLELMTCPYPDCPCEVAERERIRQIDVAVRLFIAQTAIERGDVSLSKESQVSTGVCVLRSGPDKDAIVPARLMRVHELLRHELRDYKKVEIAEPHSVIGHYVKDKWPDWGGLWPWGDELRHDEPVWEVWALGRDE